MKSSNSKKPSWSKASTEQVNAFTAGLQNKLETIHVPASLHCHDVHCSDKNHPDETDSMVLDILCAVVET